MLPTLELLEIQEELLYIQESISQYAKGSTQPEEVSSQLLTLQYKFNTILGRLPHSIHPHILQINSIIRHLQETFITHPQNAITKINEIQRYCTHLQNLSLQNDSDEQEKTQVHTIKNGSVLEALYETKQIQKQLHETTEELISLEPNLSHNLKEKLHKTMEIVLKAQQEVQVNPMAASKDFDVARDQVEEIQSEIQEQFTKILNELQLYTQLITQARENLHTL